MNLPAPVAMTPAIADAITRRHKLGIVVPEPLPNIGIINTLYRCGDDYLLRVPRDHPAHVAQGRTESIAARVARDAGVRTPRLAVYDDACDLLPVPYSIMERVPGVNLESLGRDPGDMPQVWHELGRDLARLHSGVRADGPAGALRTEKPSADPRVLVAKRASDGWFTALEARWLTAWLDRIAPIAMVRAAPCCLHLDVQATNIMVQDASEYMALLDWGCAGWGDPAWDFFGMPLRAVPTILAGHRSLAPLGADEGAEARILWRHLQMSLAVLPRGATPGLSWGEHPVAWLLEIMRFFFDHPGGRWHELRP